MLANTLMFLPGRTLASCACAAGVTTSAARLHAPTAHARRGILALTVSTAVGPSLGRTTDDVERTDASWSSAWTPTRGQLADLWCGFSHLAAAPASRLDTLPAGR